LTENDSTALTMSEEEFKEEYYPLADDYNSLYEVDDFAWFHGGRNLYDATAIGAGGSHTFTIATKGTGAEGQMTTVVTADDAAKVSISLNDVPLDSVTITAHGSYEKMRQAMSMNIFGPDKPIKTFDGVVIAVYHRFNDVEDKWIVSLDGKDYSDEEIMQAIRFQEQYFEGELVR
ncbi:MAG: hypothetical protein II583_02070, partial [Oscillospiraceae bacterium]|nr:hypothetical protein [Oscillospiraceae bacterium]